VAAQDDFGPDISNGGTIVSGDYNIIATAIAGTALTGAVANNKIGDPLLLALTNNGGPTFTNADQAASPGKGYIPYAINNGSGSATCGTYNASVGIVSVDQRGFTRGSGGFCDAGAYEFAGVASAIRLHVPAVRGSGRHKHPARRQSR